MHLNILIRTVNCSTSILHRGLCPGIPSFSGPLAFGGRVGGTPAWRGDRDGDVAAVPAHGAEGDVDRPGAVRHVPQGRVRGGIGAHPWPP